MSRTWRRLTALLFLTSATLLSSVREPSSAGFCAAGVAPSSDSDSDSNSGSNVGSANADDAAINEGPCEEVKAGLVLMMLSRFGIANEKVWELWLARAREWAAKECVAPPAIVLHENMPEDSQLPPWIDVVVPSRNCSWGDLLACEHAVLEAAYRHGLDQPQSSGHPKAEFYMLISDTSIPVKSYAYMHRLLSGDLTQPLSPIMTGPIDTKNATKSNEQSTEPSLRNVDWRQRGRSYFSLMPGLYNKFIVADRGLRPEWAKHHQWMILSLRDLEYLALNRRQWFTPALRDINEDEEEYFGCGAEKRIDFAKIMASQNRTESQTERSHGFSDEDIAAIRKDRTWRFRDDVALSNLTGSRTKILAGRPRRRIGITGMGPKPFFYATGPAPDGLWAHLLPLETSEIPETSETPDAPATADSDDPPDAKPETTTEGEREENEDDRRIGEEAEDQRRGVEWAASDELCPLRGLRRFWLEYGGNDLLYTFGPDQPRRYTDMFAPYISGLDRKIERLKNSPSKPPGQSQGPSQPGLRSQVGLRSQLRLIAGLAADGDEGDGAEERTYRDVLRDDLKIAMDARLYARLRAVVNVEPNFHMLSWGNCKLMGRRYRHEKHRHPCYVEEIDENFLQVALAAPATFFLRKVADLATVRKVAFPEHRVLQKILSLLASPSALRHRRSFTDALGDSYLTLLTLAIVVDLRQLEFERQARGRETAATAGERDLGHGEGQKNPPLRNDAVTAALFDMDKRFDRRKRRKARVALSRYMERYWNEFPDL